MVFFMRQTNGLAAQRKAVGGMANRGWPAAMHAVEFHQQRVLLRVAHRVIQQHDLAARAGIDQVAQREFADAAQAVKRDSDHWLRSFSAASCPSWSICACSDRRDRLAMGNSTKAAIRRRSAP